MNESLDWLSSEFAARVGPAIGSMTGRRTEASTGEETAPAFQATDLVWRQALDAAPRR